MRELENGGFVVAHSFIPSFLFFFFWMKTSSVASVKKSTYSFGWDISSIPRHGYCGIFCLMLARPLSYIQKGGYPDALLLSHLISFPLLSSPSRLPSCMMRENTSLPREKN